MRTTVVAALRSPHLRRTCARQMGAERWRLVPCSRESGGARLFGCLGAAMGFAGSCATAQAYATVDDDENPFEQRRSTRPGPPPEEHPPSASGPASFGRAGQSPFEGTAMAGAAAAPSAFSGNPEGLTPQLRAGRNIVLGDQSVPESERPHRVALCEWPADQARHNGDGRTATARALFKWLNKNGYDGIEATAPYFAAKFFPGKPMDEVATAAKAAAEAQGMRIFGANVWWCFDCGWDDGSIIHEMKEQVRLTKLMGGEYVTFQMWLKPDACGDGGAYRNDEPYLEELARRVEKLHQICFEQGMNCYIETHVGRVSEDPEAFCKVMDKCRVAFETNGDLSHYVYRGLRSSGPGSEHVQRILERMGHTHQRMARPFGDLSAVVDDPAEDWDQAGLTWSAFEFSLPGLRGGLSSRVICGESGPMHLVTDPMSQDAKLVPLWRAMARYADASARGEEPDITSPDDWHITF